MGKRDDPLNQNEDTKYYLDGIIQVEPINFEKLEKLLGESAAASG